MYNSPDRWSETLRTYCIDYNFRNFKKASELALEKLNSLHNYPPHGDKALDLVVLKNLMSRLFNSSFKERLSTKSYSLDEIYHLCIDFYESLVPDFFESIFDI